MITKELLEEYYNALWDDTFNKTHWCIYSFKEKHPKEYSLLCAFHRKRTQLNKDVKIMLMYSPTIYFFTLTFKNEKDKNLITTKRKECFKFCNSIFALFVMVEEEGEENGRYHLHGLGVLRDGACMEDFYKWHSREDIKRLDENKISAKVKYLTNYLSKSVPRIRRNKRLSWLRKRTDKFTDAEFMKTFPSVAINNINQELWSIDLLCLRD